MMAVDDPVLEFSVSLMGVECPNLNPPALSAVRSWLAGLLAGTLPYSDTHALALERCGSAKFVDRMQ
jgi:hypothetical protein